MFKLSRLSLIMPAAAVFLISGCMDNQNRYDNQVPPRHHMHVQHTHTVVTSKEPIAPAPLKSDQHEGMRQYVSDSDITLKVKTKLLANALFKNSSISVSTYKGVVTLTGKVASKELKRNAINITRHVNGVKSVTANLQIKRS